MLRKTFALIIFVFISSIALSQSKIEWLSWNEGYEKSKADDKVLMVDIITDNCVYCKKMDKVTFSHKKIISMVNDDFIAVKFNPEKEGKVYEVDGKEYTPTQLLAYLTNNSTMSKDPKIGFPTIVFLFPSDNELYIETGFQEANIFKYMLKSVLKIKSKKEK